MRRVAAVLICCCAVLPASALAGGSTRSWAQPQIKLVTKDGVAQSTPATFDPTAPLTAGALASFISRLTGAPKVRTPDLAAPVSMSGLDQSLVQALDLRDSAYLFYRGAKQAGLQPPARFGTESVARLLGLRLDHPVGQENLELQPQQTATRAEAAYSLAKILGFQVDSGNGFGNPGGFGGYGGDGNGFDQGYETLPTRGEASARITLPDFADSWQAAGVKAAAQTFTLPQLGKWQRQILTRAISYIGYPYVWGGTLDNSIGFDCSGLVWQVYKLSAYRNEGDLATTLRGRTTMEMSGEVPRKDRISFKNLEPGDVLFFGRGPHSKPAQVDHTGIYLGNGWLINSSGYGVAVAQLTGWYRSSFAWARRPLAEAGLT